MSPCRRWLAACLAVVPITYATKHTFHVRTSKNLIGPIGVPFGFNEHGDVRLEVHAFQLDPIEARGGTDQTINQVEAGFLLRRYKNEAAFKQFMDYLQTNSTMCAFAAFRDEDEVNDWALPDGADADSVLDVDDDFYVSSHGDSRSIQSAKEGIFLSMKSKDRLIEYQFKK
jgi:hypothetical protein